ncbi:MAG TPA: hypothetical protein VGB85_24595 [Nannocystis sp.]|jgi:hypothetical protein
MDRLQIVRDVFPISGELGSLELVDPDPYAEPDRLTIRLLVWERLPDGERQIRDIKEQQVWVGGLEDVDPERLTQAVHGWAMALAQLFAQDDVTWMETLMPADLMPNLASLVALRRPRSAEDFAEAMLSSKQRLGRWLSP